MHMRMSHISDIQNKRGLSPPARNKLKIEDLKGEDNWRTGRGRNGSQVGQVLFYLLAVQLKCIDLLANY